MDSKIVELSNCVSIYSSVCLSICLLSNYPSGGPSTFSSSLHMFFHPSVYMWNLTAPTTFQFICLLSNYPSGGPSTFSSSLHMFFHPSVYMWNLTAPTTFQFYKMSSLFNRHNVKNAPFLRDFLNVRAWPHLKRSTSARLPQFSMLAIATTKQFCETSFQNGKLSAHLTASYQCVSRFSHSICLKYCTCHAKVMPRQTKCCTCHAKHLSKPDDRRLQNATHLRKSAPWPRYISRITMSLVQCLPRKMHLCWYLLILFKCPTLAIVSQLLQNPHVLHTFDKLHNPLRLPRKTAYKASKVVRAFGALYILTWKCASRHNSVHFSTS